MKVTQEKLILINRISILCTSSKTGELPVKVKVLALRNTQKIKPYQETHDELIKGITTTTLDSRGFDKSKQYSPEEEKSLHFAVNNALNEDATFQTWLKEETEIDLVTMDLSGFESDLTDETRIDLIHALSELGIIKL